MAFEIGERVTSSFTGPGTIIGPLESFDDDGQAIPVQRVAFDNPIFGERLREVARMYPFDSAQIGKEGGDGTSKEN